MTKHIIQNYKFSKFNIKKKKNLLKPNNYFYCNSIIISRRKNRNNKMRSFRILSRQRFQSETEGETNYISTTKIFRN